ncbi:hypothetical protein [Lewinella sp. LCG006]|uniref:hypothetical protein n=1 Tax=Lewinella sp. LCG006 TaxID=3231911 RepID=UPI00346057C3
MRIVYVIVLNLVFLPILLTGQATEDSDEIKPLEQFVGYYDVGTKPNKPFFRSRWYLKEGKLYTIYDSDIDRKFEPYENNKLRYNVFYDEENLPEIDENDTTYYVVLTFEESQLKSFKIIRPRKEWETDLYGYRNSDLSPFAIYTEQELTNTHSTKNFRYNYSDEDEDFIMDFSRNIEANQPGLLDDFGLDNVPITTYKIYPNLETYHNSVLTPEAPEWQQGRVWTENEIRLVSPVNLEMEDPGLNSSDLLIHEYIHCLHWNKVGDPNSIPKWLWEGVALYKGCCEWGNLKGLDYLNNGDYPTLKEINRNSGFQYELGYYTRP